MTVTAPPRPPRQRDRVEREELEALIEDAPRRARRRRRLYRCAMIAAIGAVAAAYLGWGVTHGGSEAAGSRSAGRSNPAATSSSKIAFLRYRDRRARVLRVGRVLPLLRSHRQDAGLPEYSKMCGRIPVMEPKRDWKALFEQTYAGAPSAAAERVCTNRRARTARTEPGRCVAGTSSSRPERLFVGGLGDVSWPTSTPPTFRRPSPGGTNWAARPGSAPYARCSWRRPTSCACTGSGHRRDASGVRSVIKTAL